MVNPVFFIVPGILLFLFLPISYFDPVLVGYTLQELDDFCSSSSAQPIGFEEGCGQVKSIIFVNIGISMVGTFLIVIGTELAGKKKPEKIHVELTKNEITQESEETKSNS